MTTKIPTMNERIKELLADGMTQADAFVKAAMEKREWIAQQQKKSK